MRTLKLICLAVLLGQLLFPACGGEHRESTGGQKLSVFVSILPLSFFAQRIAGDRAGVEVLVGPGQSPETFEPTGKQMARMETADVFFTVGVPFEKSILPRIKNIYPSVQIVNTTSGITTRELDQHAGHHEHDPHVWLDPRHAKIIARNMCDALTRLDPGHGQEYERKYGELAAELDALDDEIQRLLAPLEGTTILVYHPAYGYFARRYGLVQVAIEEGGVAPGSKHVASLLEGAEERTVKAVFVQPQFSRAAAQTLAERMGAKVYTLDPLSADYVSNLRRLANTIVSAAEGH